MLGGDFSVSDLLENPHFPEVEETGITFLENATLKALGISSQTSCEEALVLADDSGLEVDALGGAPGVFSARYAGKGAGDAANLALLVEKMAHQQVRTARFRCAIVIACGGEILAAFDGTCEGTLLQAPSGSGGFGYDPVFVPTGYQTSFGELPATVKNEISHRAKAMRAAIAWLRKG